MAVGSLLQVYPFDFKPSAPPAGSFIIYTKTDDVIYLQDSSGNEFAFGATTAITSLTGEATATGPGAAATTLSNSAVIGKILTGFTPGPNSPVLATDSILQAFEKLQAQASASSGSAITALTGDVSATGPGSVAATVNSIGGSSATNVHSAELAANAATSSNTPSTIVKRDSSGNFSAGNITAALLGNATSSTTSTNFSGSLSGDVTGTQGATVVSFVGTSSAANVHNAEIAANAATAVDTPSTIVARDSSGNFAATTITANLIGNVTGNVSGSAASFTGSLSGDVTGTQSATSISSPTVTGKLLTGYVIGSNTAIAATDSILGAFEKVQGQLSATSSSAITALTGDVSATGPGSVSSTVNTVGGSSAANIHSAELATNAATSSNTPSTIVKRDSSGNFTAGTITANLTGNVTGSASNNVLKAGDTMTGELFITAAGTGLNVSNNVSVGGNVLATGTVTGSNLSGTNTGDVTTTNTNSINLGFTSGQTGLNANLNLSAASADTNNVLVSTSIKTDGLFAEVPVVTPVQIGTTNAIGSSNTTVRGDHVHAITAPVVLGLPLTGYTTGSNTPINATNSLLVGFENLQAQISATSGSAITALTGDVVATGPGSVAATIQSNVVSNSKLAQMPANTVKANTTGSTANASDVLLGTVIESSSSILTLTGWADATIGSPTITANLANAKIYIGNASNVPIANTVSGDINITNTGSTTIQSNVVSNSKLAQMPATTLKGNNSGSTTNAADLTVSQVNIMLGTVTTVGTFDSQTSQANGLDIVGNTIYAQSATTSNPGMVNNTTQSFSGNKTFTGTVAITPASTTALVVNSNSFVVDSTNNAIGIGTTPAVTAVVDIINNSGSTKAIQVTGYGSNVGLRSRRANGTLSSPTQSLSGDVLNFYSARGYGATGFAAASTGIINIVAGENFTDSTMATYIAISTTPTGSVTSAERIRINSTGRVLINTTADNGNEQLQVNGGINYTYGIISGTAGAGYIQYNAQSSKPSTPTSSFRLYGDSIGRLAWIGVNGFARVFDGTANTADRVYVLPDTSDQIATAQMTTAFKTAVFALTDATNIATDASKGNVFTVTLGGNRNLSAPTNPVDGQKITYRIKQDATGGRGLTFDTIFNFGLDIQSFTPSSGANKTDYIGCIYNGGTSKWDVVAISKSF